MKIEGRPKIELEVTISLTESEARALRCLSAYGADAFLSHYYGALGKSVLEPHENGLRHLFDTLGLLDYPLRQIDSARKAFSGKAADDARSES
jgi:hypothetical protein